MKLKSIIVEIICSLLILLWVYAALSKWLDYDTFLRQLKGSYLTGTFAGFLSIALPLTELSIAVLLLLKHTRLLGLILSMTLLALFTCYIIYILNFSPTVPCSCGGIISRLTWQEHLFFNMIYLMLNITGIVLIKNKFGIKTVGQFS